MVKKNLISTLKISGELDRYFPEGLKINSCVSEFVFLFSGQTPISAILLLDGQVDIHLRKKTTKLKGENLLLLHEEFLNAKNLKYTIAIQAGSQFAWVDKNMLNALLGTTVSTTLST